MYKLKDIINYTLQARCFPRFACKFGKEIVAAAVRAVDEAVHRAPTNPLRASSIALFAL